MTTTTTETVDFRVATDVQSALTNRSRPKPANPMEASLIYAWRGLLKIKHIPEQLLDVTMFPIMFTLMFTFLFGGALAGSTQEYLQYLLPGIIVQTIVWITMYTGMTINGDIQKGVFDRFKSLPVWHAAPLLGALLTDLLRFTMAGGVIYIVGYILGYRPEGSPLEVLAAFGFVYLFAFSLGWCWTYVGLIMSTPQAVLNLAMTIMFPLTFLSNIFVQPETMPGWLQGVVKANPVSQLADVTRGFMGGDPDTAAIGWVLLTCALLWICIAPLAFRRYSHS